MLELFGSFACWRLILDWQTTRLNFPNAEKPVTRRGQALETCEAFTASEDPVS